MNKRAYLFSAVFLVLAALSATAGAEGVDKSDGGIQKGGYGSIGWFSNYVWRGQKLSEKSVVQPSAGITYGGFGIGLWANYDTRLEEHTETDLTLDYAGAFGPLTLKGGYIYYALDGVNDTQEVFLSAKYEVVLNPSLTYYHDFDEGKGGYLVAAIGHEFAVWNDITLGLGASASMNFKNAVLGTDESGSEFTGLYNGEISAALKFPITSDISITGLAAYSFPLGSDAKNALRGISFDRDDKIVYGGATVSIGF
jgi:hypothetical protein